MNKNIKLRNNEYNNREEALDCLHEEMDFIESAGNYQAQADYWMEKYQTLYKECLRVICKGNGLKRLGEILNEDKNLWGESVKVKN